MRRELQKIPIMCRGQKNGSFKIELVLGIRVENLSPILGKNFFSFFFNANLILETKFIKNDLKVPRFLKDFKNVPQSEKS